MAISKIPMNYYSDTNIRRDKINELITEVNDLSDNPVLPTPAEGDTGKFVKVGSEGYELGEIPAELPTYSSADNGKFLTVDSNGDLTFSEVVGAFSLVKDILFNENGIGESSWLDDTGNTPITITGGVYKSVVGEYVPVAYNDNDRPYMNMPINDIYGKFMIEFELDSEHISGEHCIMGIEISGVNREFYLNINSSGNFEFKMNTIKGANQSFPTNITMDSNKHTAVIFVFNNEIKIYLDDDLIIHEFNVIMTGTVPSSMGIMWNGAGGSWGSFIAGKVYKCGHWNISNTMGV